VAMAERFVARRGCQGMKARLPPFVVWIEARCPWCALVFFAGGGASCWPGSLPAPWRVTQ